MQFLRRTGERRKLKGQDNSSLYPRIGVGVIIERDGKILLGKRKRSIGAGTWALPGGKLEKWESVEECAVREVEEETSIRIRGVEFVGFTEDMFEEGEHYITIFVKAKSFKGDPKIMEPEKLEEWRWVNKEEIKNMHLFLPLKNFIKKYKTL